MNARIFQLCVSAVADAYLQCGRLEAGCVHLVCRRCGHSMLVALSCKKRGFCPACLGRRMADTAVHLEQCVLPTVPIRHWICSLPWGLRALLGYDRRLCSEVVGAFAGELLRSLRRRAKRFFGLTSVSEAHGGVVVAVHRTDSALRLNVHLHVLALDGVYVRREVDGKLVFHPLPMPTSVEVAHVAHRTAVRIEKVLRKHGRWVAPELADEEPLQVELDDPALAACYSAAARGVGINGERTGQPTLRLIFPDHATKGPLLAPGGDAPVAEVRGVNVHAQQVVDGHDRARLERLCKYITRPCLAQERLTRRADGLLQLELKRTWKDGTRALVFEPLELMARLVAMVPPARAHQLHYFGVLSSHSSLRGEVVPQPNGDDDAHRPAPAEGDQLELFDAPATTTKRGYRHRWSWLLAHTFRADLEHCPRFRRAHALGRGRDRRGRASPSHRTRARPAGPSARVPGAARSARASIRRLTATLPLPDRLTTGLATTPAVPSRGQLPWAGLRSLFGTCLAASPAPARQARVPASLYQCLGSKRWRFSYRRDCPPAAACPACRELDASPGPAQATRQDHKNTASIVLRAGACGLTRSRIDTARGSVPAPIGQETSPIVKQPSALSGHASTEKQEPAAGIADAGDSNNKVKDAVEGALAAALTQAATAGEWQVVQQLARELEARWKAHSAPNVVKLPSRKRGIP